MTSRAQGHKIADIQLLRAFAIVLVLFAHLSITHSLLRHLPVPIANPGWVGVELFFVISGFVVARSLVRGNFGLGAFVVRRVFRLYPLLLASMAMCFLTSAFCGWLVPSAPALYAPSFTLLAAQAWSILVWTFPSTEFGASYANMAIWSLIVEMRFYPELLS